MNAVIAQRENDKIMADMGKLKSENRNRCNIVPNPKDLIALLQQADSLLRENQPGKAIPLLRNVISIRADIPEAHYMLGMAFLILGRSKDGAVALQRAVKINPGFGLAWFQLGNAHHEQQDYMAAIDAWKQANRLHKNSEICLSIGKAHLQLNQLNEAEEVLREAISLNPNNGVAYDCLGLSLSKQEHHEEAIAAHEHAINLVRNTFEQARILTHLGVAWGNNGYPEKALEYHQQALALQPGYERAYNNLAAALILMRRYEAAEVAARKATELDPKAVEAWSNLGSALSELKRDEAALECFNRAFELNPDFEYLLGRRMLLHSKLCDWKEFSENLAHIQRKTERGEKATLPFALLSLLDDPSLHRKAAEAYAAQWHPAQHIFGLLPKTSRRGKIRLGYYSADFHTHPVTAQIIELLELHDRSRFELFGFSFGPDDQSALRKRVAAAFDTFIDARHKTDNDVTALSRELGIDVAIDLVGFTGHARTSVFAERAAPLQVNYLGYPGTMGVNYYDYIIADKTLIPKDSQVLYSEKVAYMPNTYMPNDRKREISSKQFTRNELGLPSSGFVFCSFNRSYKITPQIFDMWMRVLGRVAGSVLWLSSAGSAVDSNLRQEAKNRGIDPGRLIFAERMPSLAEHFARHHVADLFLDTFPYNAHSTASDALWAGLPVLTRMGESFASRVAASLLNAIELPELITTTDTDYEALAISLAENQNKLAQIRQKLERNRLTTSLFDTPRFTKHIESAYSVMYERYLNNLPPEHIFVEQH